MQRREDVRARGIEDLKRFSDDRTRVEARQQRLKFRRRVEEGK
jgi:hypothetical protein